MVSSEINTRQPSWGSESRFFLPNEDAGTVRDAISCLDAKPVSPVFIGGSGFLLVEAARSLPETSRVVFVDVSSFQVDYFRHFSQALKTSSSPKKLREWFSRVAYPDLKDHFLTTRNKLYEEEQVFRAMRSLFRLRFFFEEGPFQQAKRAMESVDVFNDDIVNYLEINAQQHDFVYLSNVADYLPPERLLRIMIPCRSAEAVIYALVTEACADREALRCVMDQADYTLHAVSADLTVANRGLGSEALDRSWNRKGEIMLLMPGQ